MDGRNPANIPSLKKTPTQHKPKKHRIKRLEEEVRPELQDLFEKEEGKDLPIPAPPLDISEAEQVMNQVMDELAKRPKKLSEVI